MTTIVPIVGTQETDLGMLKCYMNSLGELKHKYKDCYFLPCHYGEIKNVEKEVNRIIFGYHGKVRDHEACAGGGGNGPDHPRHRCADLRKKPGTARLRAFRFLHPDLGQDLFLHGVHDGRRLYRALRAGRHHLLESLVIRRERRRERQLFRNFAVPTMHFENNRQIPEHSGVLKDCHTEGQRRAEYLAFTCPGPCGEDQHPVSGADGFCQVMGDQNGGLFCFSDNRSNVIAYGEPRLVIQGGEGLIQKQQIRF